MTLGLKMTPPRRGTAIIDQGKYLLKKSERVEKIESEFRYFQNLPTELRPFHPEVLRSPDFQEGAYLIEKIPCFDSAIVFASSESFPHAFIDELLNALELFFESCPHRTITTTEIQDRVEIEIVKRLKSRAEELKALPSYELLRKDMKQFGYSEIDSVVDDLVERARQRSSEISRARLIHSHGDTCFSNLLFYRQQLYLIDPRGISRVDDIYRSEYYDAAKVAQCLRGLYDFINYSLALPNESFRKQSLESLQQFTTRRELDPKLLLHYEAAHFICMLPLHDDHPEKMQRFLQRGLTLLQDRA